MAHVGYSLKVRLGVLSFAITWLVSDEAFAQRYTVVKPVRGIVVDEQGKPAADVEVQFPFTRRPVKKLRTDGEGKFSFEQEFGRSAQLVVAASDDGSRLGMFGFPWEAKNWKEEEIKIVLKPAEMIRVRVVDADSKPIAGAKAGAPIHYEGSGAYKVLADTNSDGDASFNIPAGMGSVSFLALKPGLGLDYANYGDTKDPVKIPSKVTLQLTGARSHEIDVVDGKDKPLEGVRVHVWLAQKPGSSSRNNEILNVGYFADELAAVSGADGKVRFDWLPEWGEYLTTFGDKTGFSHGRLDTRFKDDAPANKLIMDKLARVAGRVVLADGSPAANAEVRLTGDHYDLDGLNQTTLSNSDGRFSFDAAPHLLCMIMATNGKLVSQHLDGFVTDPEKPVEGLELKLEPGIRVYGKVTNASDKEPAKGISIMLQKKGRNLEDCPGVALPEPRNQNLPFRKSVGCQIAEFTKTNEAGEYEFFTSPGAVSLSIRLSNPTLLTDELFERFQLMNEKEHQRDFVLPTGAEQP